MITSSHNWKEPLVEFGVHVTVGTVIFVVIAIPAILINLGIKLLPSSVDVFIIQGLVAAEYLIFSVDLALFAIHTVRSTIDASRSIWRRM